jgi:hypothetical protein
VLIAAYWLLLFAAAGRGLWFRARGHRLGLLLFAAACAVALATIYEPELDDWVLTRSTANPAPPKALLIRSEPAEAARIAAAFESTGFEVAVAPRQGSGGPDPLPGCRIEIKLDGTPDSSEALAQTAQVVVVRDAGAPCPFYGEQRNLPDSVLATRRFLPYFSSFGRAVSTVPSIRLLAIVPSPTRDSLLRSLGIAPARL